MPTERQDLTNSVASSDNTYKHKYRIALFAACLNIVLLVAAFVFMLTYVVPKSSKSENESNEVKKTQLPLEFAALHTFPFLSINDFQEIETVVLPVIHVPAGSEKTTQTPQTQRLYRVEAVDQFSHVASTRMFLSRNHILDISPSMATLYDEKHRLLSEIRFFVGHKAGNETKEQDHGIRDSPRPENARQLTLNRNRNSGDNNNGHRTNNNRGANRDNGESEENETNESAPSGHRLRMRDGSNMAMISEAAAQGGIVIDASLIEISDVVDGLGTLSGDFGSLGIQGVNGLGGVTGVANGINDFATVTNGLGGVTPIGNSLLGERNMQPGRTFMSVQSVPTVGQDQMTSVPTITYAAVPSIYTVPTIAVTSVPWGVNYIPSASSSVLQRSAHTAANIICSNNLCYSVLPTN